MSSRPNRHGNGHSALQPAQSTPPSPESGDDSAEVTVNLDARALLTVAGLMLAGLLALALGAGWLKVPEVDASASLWLIFLTGLSVGGLTCLAVQGGLLTAMIAQREIQGHEAEGRAAGHLAPVLQFLTAKIVAYTILGALLGYFGSIISMSLQGWILIGVGVFMIIVVLQMFDVHPFFRRFAFQPPKSVQRLIRRESRRGGAFGPAVLGVLTIAMPCGVTLAMETLAIASDDPVRGAQIMFAFTLGTAPMFLALGLVATRLSRSSFNVFRPLAAALIVVVALVSMVSGARLLGYGSFLAGGEAGQAVIKPAGDPGSAGAPGAEWAAPVVAPAAGAPAAGSPAGSAPAMSTNIQEATINVSTHAYDPARIQIKAGLPTRLNLVTASTSGCIRAFVIPSLGIQKILPETGQEAIEIPAAEPGTIGFTCSMGMYSGAIEVVQ